MAYDVSARRFLFDRNAMKGRVPMRTNKEMRVKAARLNEKVY